MTFLDALFLAGTLALLAAVPSASVALVVTRSASSGLPNGLTAAAGIVAGDLVFAILALLGMTALSETMGALFAAVQCLGGLYLLWFAYRLIRPGQRSAKSSSSVGSTLAGDFCAGLLLTLGDAKAILFYASLFPAFIDFAALGGADIALVLIVTIIAVGGVKAAYAYAARHVSTRFANRSTLRTARPAAGCLLFAAGAYLLVKAAPKLF